MESGLPAAVRWLFLDLDSYFASCEQQEHPEWRGKPVGVVPSLGVDTTCCIAASYEAKAYGVKTGTLVADARARCPGILFVEASHRLYASYHERIVEAVETCLPVDSVLSIDEMICELMGSQRMLPNALALAHRIQQTLRARVGACLTCSIGLAPNRYLAKVASDRQKPNGITTFLQQDVPETLFPLALRDLPGIGPRMEKRLGEHGLFSVKALCLLSMAQMRGLWGGVVGERYYRWLHGEDVELPETLHRSIGHQHVLEPEFRNWEGAWMVLKKLLVKAAVRLRKEAFYARRLSVHMKLTGGLTWELDAKMPETQDTLLLLKALRELWDRHPPGRPFQVGVTCFDLVPENQHQFSLFVPPRREGLGKAMDRINAKYGKETISVGGLDPRRPAAPTRILKRPLFENR